MAELLDRLVDDQFVGRRPVLNRDLEVDAYELVCRHDPSGRSVVDLARRVGEGSADHLASGRPVWLQANQAVLHDESIDGDLSHLVFELEGQLLDDPGLQAVLDRWKQRGARIALRDEPGRSVANVPKQVDLVRIDATRIEPVDLAGRLREVRAAGAKVMADNVETHDQHKFLLESGVELFQGMFLTRPAKLQETIPQNRLATLRLIAALDAQEIEIDEVEQIVSQDVTLSYQILRYVNSAFVGLRSKVSSIRQAVVLLGPATVRQIAAVALISGDDGKPAELTRTALVRAKLCEGIARTQKEPPSAYYTAGLFSALEALTDVVLEDVMAELPLTDEVRDAVLEKTGAIGRAVRVAMAYERCDFEDPVFELYDRQGLSAAYFSAIMWVDDTMAALSE